MPDRSPLNVCTLRTLAVVQGVQLNNILRTQGFVTHSKVLVWPVYPDDRVQSILGKSFSVIVHDGTKIVVFSNFVNSFVAILIKLV